MSFDYLNLVEKTIVAEGIEGKIIMVYGGNNLGKTSQFAKIPNVIFIPLEASGLNALGDVAKLPIYDYASFKSFVDSMKSDKEKLEKDKSALRKANTRLEKEKSKSNPDKEDLESLQGRVATLETKVEENPFKRFIENYPYIAVDTVTALDKACEKYIVDMADVQELGDIGHGKLYKRLENEFYRTLTDFLSLGFTYLFSAHEDVRNLGTEENPIYQKIPKGTWKRVVKPIIDRCDIVVYLESNGTDENNNVIPSTGYLAETPEYFGRTKWEDMSKVIPVYSYENLCDALNVAIAKQKESGMRVGTFAEQQQKANENMGVDYKEIIEEIGVMVKKIYTHDNENMEGHNMLRYTAVVEDVLGMDKIVSECNAKQTEHLQLISSKTKDILASLEPVE